MKRLFIGLMSLLCACVAHIAFAAEQGQSESLARAYGRHPGSSLDRMSPEARRIFLKADKLRRAKTDSSLREAREKYAELEALGRLRGDLVAQAVGAQHFSFHQNELGDSAAAIVSGQRALQMFQRLGDHDEAGITLNWMGDYATRLAALDRALRYYQAALAEYRSINERDGESTVLNKIGLIHYHWGNVDSAVGAFRAAIAIDGELDRKRRQAMVLGNIAVVYADRGDHRQALQAEEAAYALIEKVNVPARERAQHLVSIGVSLGRLGESRRAVSYFESAKQIAVAAGETESECLAIFNHGALLSRLGSTKEGRALYETAYSRIRSLSKRNLEYESWFAEALGGVLYDVGEVHRAMQLLDEARAIAQKRGDVHVTLRVLWSQANIERDRGNAARAIDLFDQVLQVARKSQATTMEASAASSLSNVLYAAGDRTRANELLARSISLSAQVSDVFLRGVVFSRAMRRHASEGQSESAIYFGKMTVAEYQRVRSGMTGLDSNLELGYLRDHQGVYRQLASLLTAAGRLDEAQQVLDLLKERELGDFVRALPEPGQAKTPTLSAAERSALEEYERAVQPLVALGRERELLLRNSERTPAQETRLREVDAALETGNRRIESYLDGLRSRLRRQPGDAQLAGSLNESRALRDTVRALGPGVVALQAFVSDDTYTVIVTTSEVVVPRQFAIKRSEVERQISELLESVGNPRLDPRKSAAALYQTMIGPIAKDLKDAGARTLMWSLHGTLRYVPLAALYDGNRYLVEDYALAIFTPASHSRLERPPQAAGRGLGLGYSKGPVPLPNAAAEVRAVVRDVAGPGTPNGLLDGKVLIDDAFTRQAMLTALEREGPFSVVHVASHFKFEPGADTESYLVTGGPTPRFTLADMRVAPHLFRGVDLVTLSACETARGEFATDGREIESLAVLAQQQGAAAVMATLWRVADASTMKLMRAFYAVRSSAPSPSKADALRLAQLSLLGKAPAGATTAAESDALSVADQHYAHPYYWAPFIILGNWR